MKPKTALIAGGEKREAEAETCSAASVRGSVAIRQNSGQPSDDVFRTRPASGMRTIRLRYVSVKPSANPKPGMTLGFLKTWPGALGT